MEQSNHFSFDLSLQFTRIFEQFHRLCVKQPLFGMEFVIVGETLKSKDEIQNKIKQMGGKLIEAVHANVAAIISNANEVTKMEQAMRDAKSNGIHVVPETFIDDVKNIDPLELMVMCDLSDWGRDVCTFCIFWTFLIFDRHLIHFFFTF